ncbi:MAG TPA: M20/M25/M40 family metallo-hydrolase [Polyangiaceae bacterium]|nr:M20/M25/M40 family metallo-hydrolase [Polyangiaceae bacterium]
MSQKVSFERYKHIVQSAAPLLLLALSCTPTATGGPGATTDSNRSADMRLRSGSAQGVARPPAARDPRRSATEQGDRKDPRARKHAVDSADVCRPAKGLLGLALPTLRTESAPSRSNLQTWVNLLASSALRGRKAGTADSRRAAGLIAEQFQALGATPPSATGYCDSFQTQQVRDQNVVAHVPASDSRCPWVVVGAHYDALGTDENGVMYPGADDNASGGAVLMELARLVQVGAVKPKVGLVLVAFGAEEAGLVGSRAYVRRPSVPLSDVSMMINVDMAGRKPAGYPIVGYEVYGRNMTRSSHRVRMAAANAKVRAVPAQLGDRSDSSSFAPHVPTVFFCTMVHADYHKPTDLPDRVDFAQTMRTLALVTAMVEGMPCVSPP